MNILSYPGGDGLTWRFIRALLPGRVTVLSEPFAGAMHLTVNTLAREPVGVAVAGDVDPLVVNVWLCVLDPACRAEMTQLVVGYEKSPQALGELNKLYGRVAEELVGRWAPPPPNPTLAALEVLARYSSWASRRGNANWTWNKVDTAVERLRNFEQKAEALARTLSGRLDVAVRTWRRTVRAAEDAAAKLGAEPVVYADPPHHCGSSKSVLGGYAPWAWTETDAEELLRYAAEAPYPVLVKYGYCREVLEAAERLGLSYVVALERLWIGQSLRRVPRLRTPEQRPLVFIANYGLARRAAPRGYITAVVEARDGRRDVLGGKTGRGRELLGRLL